ncbi:hypothetical protein GQR58_003605 [Nymphon striatum]|nr:hypothetical protein GQR58_003605 [Nymphon striatum]
MLMLMICSEFVVVNIPTTVTYLGDGGQDDSFTEDSKDEFLKIKVTNKMSSSSSDLTKTGFSDDGSGIIFTKLNVDLTENDVLGGHDYEEFVKKEFSIEKCSQWIIENQFKKIFLTSPYGPPTRSKSQASVNNTSQLVYTLKGSVKGEANFLTCQKSSYDCPWIDFSVNNS